MRTLSMVALFFTFALSARTVAQCAKDFRPDPRGGIVVTDFTITGTTTLGSTELARLAGDFVGSCYKDDAEEMQERLRAGFQDRGYFLVEVKNLSFKPDDPLGILKPVGVEAEVAEGLKFKVENIAFLENHAFSTEQLRQEFPLKKGDLFERSKIATGIRSLVTFYASNGFHDFFCTRHEKSNLSFHSFCQSAGRDEYVAALQ